MSTRCAVQSYETCSKHPDKHFATQNKLYGPTRTIFYIQICWNFDAEMIENDEFEKVGGKLESKFLKIVDMRCMSTRCAVQSYETCSKHPDKHFATQNTLYGPTRTIFYFQICWNFDAEMIEIDEFEKVGGKLESKFWKSSICASCLPAVQPKATKPVQSILTNILQRRTNSMDQPERFFIFRYVEILMQKWLKMMSLEK